ncbi:MAG TPA: hypothetical protein VFW45_03350 [Candidatus Polarisedimenticolia bacterium]|nr:hypothetical protein [Candidatus Polarisedimenticolia bacterium]
MEPIGAAGYVMVAAAAVLAIGLGALAGAIAWVARCNPVWMGLLAAGGYLVETVLLHSAAPGPSIIIGFPPLLMTLLIAWLVAGYLGKRARLGRPWAALAGSVCALVLGFLWGFSFRLGLWPPISLALVADTCLILWIVLRWKAVARMGRAEES